MKKIIISSILLLSLAFVPTITNAAWYSSYFSASPSPVINTKSVSVKVVPPKIKAPANRITTPSPSSTPNPNAPVLTGLYPVSGKVGDTIHIYGTFSHLNNTVYTLVNGKLQTIKPAYQSTTELQITVPIWLENQGVVNFSVENSDFVMSKTSLSFTVLATPVVESNVKPLRADLTVNGQDMTTVEKGSPVSLRWSSTSATSCSTNWDAAQGTEGSVSVTINEGKVFVLRCTDGKTTVQDSVSVSILAPTINAASSNPSRAPAITSITPTKARIGQTITIYGTNFTSSQNTVYIKTQNTTTTVIPQYQGPDYVKFVLPSFVKAPASFAVENGNLEISSYIPFTVDESTPTPAPVSRAESSSVVASVLYAVADFFDSLSR